MGRTTRRNSITSAELLARVNPENKQLISDFLQYLKSTGKSPTTIAVYQNDLDIAMVWNLQHNTNKPFVKWTKRNIVAFQNWLIQDLGNGPARVRRVKATLSSMSNFVETILDDEYPEFRNIIHKVESPVSQPVREKTILDDANMDNVLLSLVNTDQPEKACMLALALYSGRRKSELVRFKVGYFDDENIIYGSLYRTPEKIKTKGRGNGKFLYCYTLVKKFKPWLDIWLNARKEQGIESEWLFPDPGNPAEHRKVGTLNSWARTISRIMGGDFYWHATRHRYVSYLVEAGLPDSVIQNIVGWEDVSMVRLYDDTPIDREIEKYFSNGEIVASKLTTVADL